MNKCSELYKFIDEKTPWEVAGKILLFSRGLNVDQVIEILGGKTDRQKAIYKEFLLKHDWKDNSLEHSIRRIL